jgi:hypothetical protein
MPLNDTSVTPEVAQWWKDLIIEQWVRDTSMPLLIRKPRGNRGQSLTHLSGRILVPTDNAPANWCLSAYLAGWMPSLNDIRLALRNGTLPIAMILRSQERTLATFRGVQRANMIPPNLNSLGYRVSHKQAIGLNSRTALTVLPISTLEAHFVLFLSPSNMFLEGLSTNSGIAA